jgi:hypothetical protein
MLGALQLQAVDVPGVPHPQNVRGASTTEGTRRRLAPTLSFRASASQPARQVLEKIEKKGYYACLQLALKYRNLGTKISNLDSACRRSSPKRRRAALQGSAHAKQRARASFT